MGLSASKIKKEISVENVQEGSLPSTPILTPTSPRKKELLDPRSPSTNIARTPLELHDSEGKEDNETPVKHFEFMLGIDPRSPTTDFVRTPIVINACDGEPPEKITNKNLEKVLRSEICTPSRGIPPKLLESSPVKSRSDAYKRKSFVGLLETNIDFTETDLDAVIREKSEDKEISSPSRINVVETENIDPRSPTTDFLRTPIQIVKKIGEIELNDTKTDPVIVCEANESKELPKQKNEVEELQFFDNNEIEKVKDEISEHINTSNSSNSDTEVSVPQTQSAPVTPPTTEINDIVLHTSGCKSVPVTPPLVNLTADVKELDKKLTDLIYEDRDIVVCPRIVKLKDVTERSPLRNRNVIDSDKRSNQKLRVSDKPRKSEFTVSKIPVFQQKPREKIRKGKIQCENTPPRCMEKKRISRQHVRDIEGTRTSRQTYWDNTDTTLYL